MKQEEMKVMDLEELGKVTGGSLTEAQKSILMSTAVQAKKENWDWDTINESLGRWNLNTQEAADFIRWIWDQM